MSSGTVEEGVPWLGNACNVCMWFENYATISSAAGRQAGQLHMSCRGRRGVEIAPKGRASQPLAIL